MGKKVDTKVHTVLFHFYEIQEQVRVIHGANITMSAEIVYGRSMRKHSGVMKVSYILNWVMISRICTFVKTPQTTVVPPPPNQLFCFQLPAVNRGPKI